MMVAQQSTARSTKSYQVPAFDSTVDPLLDELRNHMSGQLFFVLTFCATYFILILSGTTAILSCSANLAKKRLEF